MFWPTSPKDQFQEIFLFVQTRFMLISTSPNQFLLVTGIGLVAKDTACIQVVSISPTFSGVCCRSTPNVQCGDTGNMTLWHLGHHLPTTIRCQTQFLTTFFFVILMSDNKMFGFIIKFLATTFCMYIYIVFMYMYHHVKMKN